LFFNFFAKVKNFVTNQSLFTATSWQLKTPMFKATLKIVHKICGYLKRRLLFIKIHLLLYTENFKPFGEKKY